MSMDWFRWFTTHWRCAGATTDGEIARLATSGDEFSIAFKVNYTSEDLLPVMVTSRLLMRPYLILQKSPMEKYLVVMFKFSQY